MFGPSEKAKSNTAAMGRTAGGNDAPRAGRIVGDVSFIGAAIGRMFDAGVRDKMVYPGDLSPATRMPYLKRSVTPYAYSSPAIATFA